MKQDNVFNKASRFFKIMARLTQLAILLIFAYNAFVYNKSAFRGLSIDSETNWSLMIYGMFAFAAFKLVVWAFIYENASRVFASLISTAPETLVAARSRLINTIAYLLFGSFLLDVTHLAVHSVASSMPWSSLVSGAGGGNGIFNMLVPSTTGSSSVILALVLLYFSKVISEKEQLESELKLTV